MPDDFEGPPPVNDNPMVAFERYLKRDFFNDIQVPKYLSDEERAILLSFYELEEYLGGTTDPKRSRNLLKRIKNLVADFEKLQNTKNGGVTRDSLIDRMYNRITDIENRLPEE